MNTKPSFTLLESDQNYEAATARYEEIKRAPKNSEEHKEKLVLVHLISEYEKQQWDLPKVDAVELCIIYKEDHGNNTKHNKRLF